MLVMKSLMAALLSFAVMSAVAFAAQDQFNRFNVLFIAIDDLRPELGCYGSSAAQTPHLDRLAAQGVLFNRHYAQVPTCGASRYSLLTGRTPASSGVTSGNEALYRGPAALSSEQLAGAQTLPELFRRSGYRTVCIGKISHTPDGRVFAYDGTGDGRDELPHAWDELATPFGSWGRGWGAFFAYAGGRHREDGQGHRALMEFAVERDDELPDGLMAAEAVRQLHKFKSSGERFFLGVGFFKPHLPFVAPQQDWDANTNVEPVSGAASRRPDSPWWHRSGEFHQYDAPFEGTRPLSAEAQRQSRRAYLACVRYVDRQAGRVLQALDDTGLAEHTIVVVWGDHGWHLGEQQIWGKHSPFERALRSVLIIRAPGSTRAGLRLDALVETTDLYPTLMDLCRPTFDQTRHPLDGRSLRPLLTGEAIAIRNTAVSWWQDAVSVRSATHRLIARGEGGRASPVALYDLSTGLDNTTNIIDQEPGLAKQLLREVE